MADLNALADDRVADVRRAAMTEFEMYRNTRYRRKLRAETTLALVQIHVALRELLADLDEWRGTDVVAVSEMLTKLRGIL